MLKKKWMNYTGIYSQMIKAHTKQTKAMVIHLYEGSTCRYVRLNALNVLHAHGPCFNAPFFDPLHFKLKPLRSSMILTFELKTKLEPKYDSWQCRRSYNKKLITKKRKCLEAIFSHRYVFCNVTYDLLVIQWLG